jgi:hypothetical protein
MLERNLIRLHANFHRPPPGSENAVGMQAVCASEVADRVQAHAPLGLRVAVVGLIAFSAGILLGRRAR